MNTVESPVVTSGLVAPVTDQAIEAALETVNAPALQEKSEQALIFNRILKKVVNQITREEHQQKKRARRRVKNAKRRNRVS